MITTIIKPWNTLLFVTFKCFPDEPESQAFNQSNARYSEWPSGAHYLDLNLSRIVRHTCHWFIFPRTSFKTPRTRGERDVLNTRHSVYLETKCLLRHICFSLPFVSSDRGEREPGTERQADVVFYLFFPTFPYFRRCWLLFSQLHLSDMLCHHSLSLSLCLCFCLSHLALHFPSNSSVALLRGSFNQRETRHLQGYKCRERAEEWRSSFVGGC